MGAEIYPIVFGAWAIVGLVLLLGIAPWIDDRLDHRRKLRDIRWEKELEDAEHEVQA